MELGYARVSHVPDRAIYLSGYPRDEKSKGVHIAPEISALTISCLNQTFVLCVVDTLIISTQMVHWIRKKVASQSSLQYEHIHVCTTHTHSAPCIYEMNIPDPPMDQQWRQATLQACVDVILESGKYLVSCECYLKTIEIQGLYGNRSHPDAWANKEVYCFTFLSQGKQIGRLFNISCHNTINSTDNIISADLFGGIRKEIHREDCFCIVTNGVSGDVSTRYERQGNDCAEVDRVAHCFVEQCQLEDFGKKIQTKRVYTDVVCSHAYQRVLDQTNLQEKIQTLERKKSKHLMKDWDEFLLESYHMRKRKGEFYHFLESSIVLLGELIIISIPGEAVCYFDAYFKGKFPGYQIIYIGTCDGYCGYLVPEDTTDDFEIAMAEVSISDTWTHMRRIEHHLSWMTSTYCGNKQQE